MPIEPWFPLAVYYEDLADAAEHKPALVAAARACRDEQPKRNADNKAAWTGDIHGIQRLHDDPRFAWLTARVEEHTTRYLAALGYQLDQLSLHFQRSWPVIAGAGEWVAKHRHAASHVSAVYWVQSPAESGALTFHEDDPRNECAPGVQMHDDQVVRPNPLSYGTTSYQPVEGRLVLFPSKTPHSVSPEDIEGQRISISYDIVLTAREDAAHPSYEFLMPSPATWRAFGQSAHASTPPAAPAAEHGAC